MVPVVSFVGYHNSGKTTVATEVVKKLKEKGYRVAVLKSTKEKRVFTDKPGKDSYRYREAGADAVGLFSPEELFLTFRVKKESTDLTFLSFLLFDEYDVVVCEGFKRAPVPKIEVIREELKEPPLFEKDPNVVAVVTDSSVRVKEKKVFHPEQVGEIATFIEEEFIKKREEEFPDEVELFVNGKRIPMKFFLKGILKEVLIGFLKPLKGIENPVERIDVRVVKGRGKNS